MVDFDIAVVGGGFRSIMAAYGYAKRGESVVLLDAGNKLGGFMSPINWRDNWIDRGPQFFDNFNGHDLVIFDEMLGQHIFKDISFKYGSFINNKLTDGFAIPDWRTFGSSFSQRAFADLLSAALTVSDKGHQEMCLSDVIAHDGGKTLAPVLEQLTKKFLGKASQYFDIEAKNSLMFFGRKLLFDNETSVDLKKSPLIDSFLAASKHSLSEKKLNLYPTDGSMETVRSGMEKALKNVGATVHLNSRIESINDNPIKVVTNNDSFNVRKVFMGCDIGTTEKLCMSSNFLSDLTHPVPLLLHLVALKKRDGDRQHYVVNYEPSNSMTRVTYFSNYMNVGDSNTEIICIEQPVKNPNLDNAAQLKFRDIAIKELQKMLPFSQDDLLYSDTISVPVSYRVPLLGFSERLKSTKLAIKDKFGDAIEIPSVFNIDRKSSLDELVGMGVLSFDDI